MSSIILILLIFLSKNFKNTNFRLIKEYQNTFLLYYKIYYRIMYRMKVTAIISDNIISEVKKYTRGKNLTESLTIALEEWLASKRIKELNSMIKESPLEFKEGFSAEKTREINRK